MKKIVIISGLFLINMVFSQVKIEDKEAYKKEIVQLLEITKAFETQQVFLDQMKEIYAEHEKATLMLRMLEGMEKEMREVSIDIALESYSKYFSIEEIKEMISFYQTDFGKKINQYNPVIIEEMSIKGKEWGQRYAQKFIEEHQDEFFPEK